MNRSADRNSIFDLFIQIWKHWRLLLLIARGWLSLESNSVSATKEQDAILHSESPNEHKLYGGNARFPQSNNHHL